MISKHKKIKLLPAKLFFTGIVFGQQYYWTNLPDQYTSNTLTGQRPQLCKLPLIQRGRSSSWNLQLSRLRLASERRPILQQAKHVKNGTSIYKTFGILLDSER